MTGRSSPVTGADTRTRRASPRPGAGSTTGRTETTGVPAPWARWRMRGFSLNDDSGMVGNAELLASLDKRISVPLTNIRNHVPVGKVSDGGNSAVADIGSGAKPPAPRKRADARRNEETLLEAAAAAFITSGVDVPVRDIAANAGVGVGTIYRHFPTRAGLIGAVYRHQVEARVDAGPALLADSDSPHTALTRWIDLFVDFLVTKHGLAEALQSDDAAFATLHAYILDRLVPVCAEQQ